MTTLSDLVAKIVDQVLNPVITLLFVLATAVFIWGIILYVVGSQGDAEKLKVGKRVILWGIIGLFIMVSAWGIVKVLCNFFDTCQMFSQPSSDIELPEIFP